MRYSIIVSCFVLVACSTPQHKQVAEESPPQRTFASDLAFLKKYDDVIVLTNGDARVVVSPRYQGKVFTSTSGGSVGRSYGWINYDAFDAPDDPHMNAYGGENRFWLGPEGNRFSLFFRPGAEMTFENWVTPAPVDSEPWDVAEKSVTSVTLSKSMHLSNHAGTPFSMDVHREVRLLGDAEAQALLGVEIVPGLSHVGYMTINRITNIGNSAWTRRTGAPCIWILDMFTPSPSTVVMVPFRKDASHSEITTDYFGEVPPERINISDGLVLFKADGRSRGKIGVSGAAALPMSGSYDAENKILTVVIFDTDAGAVYLNQEWSTAKDPFDGDAVNAYNDGPLKDGSQMGPFYELESVSPAAFLGPRGTLSHTHTVIHLTGPDPALLTIIEKLFGPADQIVAFARR